jgi:DNA-binding CsgD family transcriptional regulator/tetratricopeptide (TPR) repeat protein
MVLGDAGIGKSALLNYLESRATGFTALRANGTESESELAFSGLADLLRPLLGELGALPQPQAAALAGALALGPPVPGDPFAIGTATLGLLSRAAERSPLVALIEDAQWLDRPSLAAIVFAARRVQAEGILIVFAVREGEPPAVSMEGLGTLRLAHIDAAAASALLALTTPLLPPPVAERICAAAGGNPLALIEMPLALADAQRSGTEAPEGPMAVGPRLTAIFKRRVAALSAQAQSSLLIAAASDRDDVGPVLEAMRGSGLGPVAIEEAETAGFLTVRGDQLIWRHPLVRAAVYHGAAPGARRAAHRALAEALDAHRAPDSRAWHLASATLGHDEQAALALEGSAANARERRGSAAAARAFERAARISADPEARARRLFEAAVDLLSTAEPGRARELLSEALELSTDVLRRSDIVRTLAMADMFRGSPESTVEMLSAEADRIEPLDRGRAAVMRADACVAITMTGDVGKTLALAERAQSTAPLGGPHTAALAQSMLANALVLAGRVSEARPYLGAARGAFTRDGLPPVPFRHHLVQTLGHSAIWLGEHVEARRFLGDVVTSARQQSAVAGLAFPLACLSELEYRTGRWTIAYALADDSVRMATEVGARSQLAFSLVCLARVEAGIGKQDDCRAHLRDALAISRELSVGSIEVYARSVAGLLELSLGNPDRAVLELGPLSRLVDRWKLAHPDVVQWGSDFVEALARGGDPVAAQAALDSFERQARATESRWGMGEAARCRGLLADADGFEKCFADALEWLQDDVAVFERARTLLCLGERRRRSRRLGPARDALGLALAGFEQLGAQPWILRTRRELHATGARLGPPPEQPVQRLTPQELQVAIIAATGATNREIAASLFLSPKTVDFHLGKVYRKLEVRSRSQLTVYITSREDIGG